MNNKKIEKFAKEELQKLLKEQQGDPYNPLIDANPDRPRPTGRFTPREMPLRRFSPSALERDAASSARAARNTALAQRNLRRDFPEEYAAERAARTARANTPQLYGMDRYGRTTGPSARSAQSRQVTDPNTGEEATELTFGPMVHTSRARPREETYQPPSERVVGQPADRRALDRMFNRGIFNLQNVPHSSGEPSWVNINPDTGEFTGPILTGRDADMARLSINNPTLHRRLATADEAAYQRHRNRPMTDADLTREAQLAAHTKQFYGTDDPSRRVIQSPGDRFMTSLEAAGFVAMPGSGRAIATLMPRTAQARQIYNLAQSRRVPITTVMSTGIPEIRLHAAERNVAMQSVLDDMLANPQDAKYRHIWAAMDRSAPVRGDIPWNPYVTRQNLFDWNRRRLELAGGSGAVETRGINQLEGALRAQDPTFRMTPRPIRSQVGGRPQTSVRTEVYPETYPVGEHGFYPKTYPRSGRSPHYDAAKVGQPHPQAGEPISTRGGQPHPQAGEPIQTTQGSPRWTMTGDPKGVSGTRLSHLMSPRYNAAMRAGSDALPMPFRQGEVQRLLNQGLSREQILQQTGRLHLLRTRDPRTGKELIMHMITRPNRAGAERVVHRQAIPRSQFSRMMRNIGFRRGDLANINFDTMRYLHPDGRITRGIEGAEVSASPTRMVTRRGPTGRFAPGTIEQFRRDPVGPGGRTRWGSERINEGFEELIRNSQNKKKTQLQLISKNKNIMGRLFEYWRHFEKDEDDRTVVTFEFDNVFIFHERLSQFQAYDPDNVKASIEDNILMIEKAQRGIAEPTIAVHIVTTRHKKNENDPVDIEKHLGISIQEFLDKHGLQVDGVHYTDGKPLLGTVVGLGSDRHYGPDLDVLEELEKYGIDTELTDIQDPSADYDEGII